MTTQRQFNATDVHAPGRERAEEAGRERERLGDTGDTMVDDRRPPRPARDETGPESDERAASYLPEQTTAHAGERWQQIQADFVDDPRRAVGEAHELVGELMQRIVDRFGQERAALEQQWSRGGDVSTEELRVCLQQYRAFFSRLLPAVDGRNGGER